MDSFDFFKLKFFTLPEKSWDEGLTILKLGDFSYCNWFTPASIPLKPPFGKVRWPIMLVLGFTSKSNTLAELMACFTFIWAAKTVDKLWWLLRAITLKCGELEIRSRDLNGGSTEVWTTESVFGMNVCSSITFVWLSVLTIA